MPIQDIEGSVTAADPWLLKTPPGKSEFEAYRDETADPPALVVPVGSTQLRCLTDLHEHLSAYSDWMPLGNADEQKPAQDGTVEAQARSPESPVSGSRVRP